MKKEAILDFTRRITQCNKGQMIVIMYDILFAYLEDVKEAEEAGDREAFKVAIRKADRVLKQLCDSLDFKYDIAKELYPLYVFCREALAKCMVKGNTSELSGAEEVLSNLAKGFEGAAKKDTSAPLMKNTQQVYAGMTYGKENLTEMYQDSDTSRGFFA